MCICIYSVYVYCETRHLYVCLYCVCTRCKYHVCKRNILLRLYPKSFHDYPQVSTCLDVLQKLVRLEGWHLRQSCALWVRWMPRERNVFADALANLAIVHQKSFAYISPNPSTRTSNFVGVSDGAARTATKLSSASWAIFAVNDSTVQLVRCKAICLNELVPSQSAETLGLELALAAMLCLSRGADDIFPHRYDHLLCRSELPVL